MPGATVQERATAARPSLERLLASLPADVHPAPRRSFGGEQISSDPLRMDGWQYDWSDKGADPPPWSDWPNRDD